MKIIKSFEDPEFFEKYHNDHGIQDEAYRMKGHWYWGLSDEGNLYYHSSIFCRENEWNIFNSPSNGKMITTLSIRDMKKIVKEFGHLLIFI